MRTKTCSSCGETKPSTNEFFNTAKNVKCGLAGKCKTCQKRYREQNKASKSDYDKEYREQHREKLNSYRNQYYKDNKEKLNAYRKKHYEQNKSDYIANAAKRKADKRNQTPDFANLDLIARIYQFCPEGFHVEHMIPLKRGGFHHESNLCYLPAQINHSKGSKRIEEFGVDYFNENVNYWQDVLYLI